jgi:hypothetical protein
MAKLILRSDGGRTISDLPPVCMACGAPATVRKSKTFSWCPPWVGVLILVGLLPYVVVSLVMTKRQAVETPLCDRHKSYWWLYPLVMALIFIGLLFLGGLTVASMNNRHTQEGNLSGVLCVATLLGLLALLFVVAIMNSRRIRPTEITDRVIRLTSVSEAFVDAVEADEFGRRSAFDRMDDYRREPRRYAKEEDDDRYTR